MEKIGFRIPLLLSIALYVTALFLPVYMDKTLPGWLALVGGWTIFLNELPTWISWFANVFFFLTIITIIKRKKPKPLRALIFSILTLFFGLVILAAGKTVTGASETMAKLPLGTAFYAWIGSFVLLVIAAWVKFKKR